MDGSGARGRLTGIRVIATAIIAALLLVGSVAATHRPSSHAQTRQYVFYLIPGLSNDAFFVTMQQGAQAAARRLGITLIYRGSPYAFSPAAQIPYLDAAIAQRPDAILIAPTDTTALIRPIRRAVRAGIPVITVDTFITAPLAVTNVRSRNTLGGRLAADALARAIHFRGAVAGIGARPGISTTDSREQGFTRRLRRYNTIQFLGMRYDNNIMPRTERITSRLLAHYPTLDGIFAMNSLSGYGVLSALQKTHRMGQVKLVEFDAEPIQVQALRQRLVQALIAQDPRAIGNRAVRLAYQWVTGHRRGIKKVYYTSEATLTRENVDNPKFKRFLYLGG